VSEGLDSALNIDRESFNSAHPHTVYITRWLHGALRQLATAQKRLSSEAREHTRDESTDAVVSEIQRVATEVWTQETDDPAARPPEIEISESGQNSARGRGDVYVYSRSAVLTEKTKSRTAKARARDEILEQKLKCATRWVP
jgi:hydrogenase maturation factor HypE